MKREVLNARMAAEMSGMGTRSFLALVRRGEGPPLASEGVDAYYRDDVVAWIASRLPPPPKECTSPLREKPGDPISIGAAAEIIGWTGNVLHHRRKRGGGPPYYQSSPGSPVWYSRATVIEWAKGRQKPQLDLTSTAPPVATSHRPEDATERIAKRLDEAIAMITEIHKQLTYPPPD